ncbi:hypothetical protein G9A89_007977 [Geosiphon pyriformis]|nr:hypothetical protein G9A89_007977 [Geosiphon pyriformis]
MNDSEDNIPYAPAAVYYNSGNNSFTSSNVDRVRRFATSHGQVPSRPPTPQDGLRALRKRRASHDEKAAIPRKFLIDVLETRRLILEQEDTDGDCQITINDAGPKSVTLGTLGSGGYSKFEVRGTYMLSTLLQELALALDNGRKYIVLDEARLNENPVDRLSRMIKCHFWDGLTRRIDAEGLEVICADPKNRTANHNARIYIPYGETEVFEYYKHVAETRTHLNLQVEMLPQDISPEYVKSINDRPGILSLAMRKYVDDQGNTTLRGVPFVVPGGRFNEMYGWDSYFETLGLALDGKIEVARGMVDNFTYEIKHYGKILNANRSYYLTRSQPPFLTDMAIRVYENLTETEAEKKQWLATAITAAIKEYHTVWMCAPRFDLKTGLSKYYPIGLGIPPETEASHFDHLILPYAARLGLSIPEYAAKYHNMEIHEPELDEYFLHDRAVRESGHDTTYRFEKRCANLTTIDLNALLYKYEIDLGELIRDKYDDHFVLEDGNVETSAVWFERAMLRKERIDRYCWNEEKSLYYDYDTVKEKQSEYESVTAFWALWAGCASKHQAEKLVRNSLPKFEVFGGLVSGTEESRGTITLDRPNRQWDYPLGWAPHQMMAWRGLEIYGYINEARRLAYRWLYTITKSFVDFNGVVPEKYDVVSLSHLLNVEYGNVGTDFKFVPREGFGWMNASYQLGLSYLTNHMRRVLGTCTSPEVYLKDTEGASLKANNEATPPINKTVLENGDLSIDFSKMVAIKVTDNSSSLKESGRVFP